MDFVVNINGDSRSGGAADPSWIAEKFREGRRAGNLCVRVEITAPMVNIVLVAGDCDRPQGSRHATAAEQRYFDAWEKRGLNGADPSPGALISFLQQIDRIAA